MNPLVKTGLAALIAAGVMLPSFAQNPADETTEAEETGEKVQGYQGYS